MRIHTIRTKVYDFSELSDKAKEQAISDQIQFEINTMNEQSTYWQCAVEMERMHTPWFLAECIYENKESIIETIEANEYEFTETGKLFIK